MFKKLPSESIIEFCLRMAEEKLTNKSITWQGIADSLPTNFNVFKSEAWVRKTVRDNQNKAHYFSPTEEEITCEDANASFNTYEDILSKLDSKIIELKKERVKLQDERIQGNAYFRRISREETIIEIAKDFADKMSSKKILSLKHPTNNPNAKCKEAILCLSDWHYGMCCDNYWNKYDPEIAKERISKLLNETISYIKNNNVDTIHVLNLGDLIAGRIHLPLRLESRFDVITQVMEISEILAEFLNELANNVAVVEYYSCSDNHSRLEPNKADSLELESLCRITDWYLSERLSNRSDNIFINKNIYGDDIITFKCMGYSIASMHGHKDSPSGCIDRISSMTRNSYDLIIMAHRHHFSMDENGQCRLLCNGSLMGTDTYAKDLRLNSKPSQTLIIVDENQVCESIHIIELN